MHHFISDESYLEIMNLIALSDKNNFKTGPVIRQVDSDIEIRL